MKIRTRERYVLMSADYSQQEPKLLTQLCGDENMLESYRQGKDLYSQIAAIAFHTTYERCLEHFPKDTPIIQRDDGKWDYATEEEIQNNLYTKLADGETDTYKAGKSLRSQAKSILLGIMYGRGEKSIAEQLGCTVEEAKVIKDDVYEGFPAIRQFEEESLKMAREKGYVTTLWGRKRRLPEIQLPNFEFFYKPADVGPTEFGKIFQPENRIPDIEADGYKYQMLNATHYRAKEKLIQKLNEQGVYVQNNEGKIADATRQVINSRVQGSASDMSKKAMIAVNTDDALKAIKGQVIIPVHDELILQAPLRNARVAKQLFAFDMEHAAEDRLTVPIKCDVTVAERWYGAELDLNKELEGLSDD